MGRSVDCGVRKTQEVTAGFEQGERGREPLRRRWSLEAGKDKAIDSPLEPTLRFDPSEIHFELLTSRIATKNICVVLTQNCDVLTLAFG